MKNKGFTLIELLGVIIILALLMIIVFPSIINSVKNSSNKTDDLTKELIYNAANLFIDDHINDFPKMNGSKYSIELSTLVDEGLLTGPIKLSGSDLDITNSKCIQVTYNNGYKYELKDSGTCENLGMCTLEDKDSNGVASLSDVVTCGTENFYVMYNENSEITMLSMYNLYVGKVHDSTTNTINLLESPTNLQKDGHKAGVAFSSTTYWSSTVSNYPAFVYNENSNLYQYVSEYERILNEELKVNNARATLISYEQVSDLKDNKGNPSWLYSTNYWTGTAAKSNGIWHSGLNDTFYDSCYAETCGQDSIVSISGVRPVVTISTNQI